MLPFSSTLVSRDISKAVFRIVSTSSSLRLFISPNLASFTMVAIILISLIVELGGRKVVAK
jgi:hypothetical protein